MLSAGGTRDIALIAALNHHLTGHLSMVQLVHVSGSRVPMQDINGPFLLQYAHSLSFAGVYRDSQVSKTVLTPMELGHWNSDRPHQTDSD